ncbi:MAG: NADH-quinone oxidoreductase subunit B family protein [Gemmatimonadales bacterium]
MLDLLRARAALGVPGARFPEGDLTLPPRFRGRPVATDGRELPVLDLGSCLFSPEEATYLEERGVALGADHRLSATSREALTMPGAGSDSVQPLADAMRRLFGRSLRLRSVAAGSCGGCEAELVALGNVVFDLARFGVSFVASPRHADGLIITGAVSRNMTDELRRTYEAVGDPKLVIAVGACAASGGPFRGSTEVLDGVPSDIPVDLWIAGCPPHPFTVLDGILRLLGRLDARQIARAAPE